VAEPQAATRLGLKSGDYVRLRNQDGVLSNRIAVKATQRIRPDCVYMVHGFGHTSRGLRHAYGKGASDAATHHPLQNRSAHGRHRDERQLCHPRTRGGGLTMSRYIMVIDTRRCVGCHDCVVACQTENNVPRATAATGSPRRSAASSPPCGSRSAPSAATTARTRRASTAAPPAPATCTTAAAWCSSHHEKCIGCKACLAACPYDARFIHPEGYADKCTFCIHRVEKGQDPACVSVCPTHCMHFGDLDDPQSAVSKLLASRPFHTLLPEAGTKPRIYYLT
jgi:Fe-S-cluster-containing dehydrogenase component